MLLLSSCCKDKADRTEYLSSLQEDIITMYEAGDAFSMLRNDSDTIAFTVDSQWISEEEERYSFCNKFYSRGWVFINGNTLNKQEGGTDVTIIAREEDRDSDLVEIIFNSRNYKYSKRIGLHTVENKEYTNTFCFLKETYNDTLYITLEDGIIEVKEGDVHFTLID